MPQDIGIYQKKSRHSQNLDFFINSILNHFFIHSALPEQWHQMQAWADNSDRIAWDDPFDL